MHTAEGIVSGRGKFRGAEPKEFVNISKRAPAFELSKIREVQEGKRGGEIYEGISSTGHRARAFPSHRTYFMRLWREIIVSGRGVPAFSNFGYRSAGRNQLARSLATLCTATVSGTSTRSAILAQEIVRRKGTVQTGQESLYTELEKPMGREFIVAFGPSRCIRFLFGNRPSSQTLGLNIGTIRIIYRESLPQTRRVRF